MVFVGVSKLGQTQLIFVDPAVKSNGAYYCDVLFTQQLYCLSYRRSRETSSSCSKTVLLCSQHNQTSWTGDTRVHCTRPVAANSPADLNPLGRNTAAGLPDKSSWPGWTEAASYRWLGTKHHRWSNWWVAQTSACVYSCHRMIFWAFALTQGHAYDNFSVLSLWIFKENCCYCVKYVRFLQFCIFCISQGSGATRLRCGGKYNNSFAANSLLSPTVKEFFKNRSKFHKVMPNNGATPFWLTV